MISPRSSPRSDTARCRNCGSARCRAISQVNGTPRDRSGCGGAIQNCASTSTCSKSKRRSIYLLLGRGDCVAMSYSARSLRPRLPAGLASGELFLASFPHRATKLAGREQISAGGNHPLPADRLSIPMTPTAGIMANIFRPQRSSANDITIRARFGTTVLARWSRPGLGHRRDRSVHRCAWPAIPASNCCALPSRPHSIRTSR